MSYASVLPSQYTENSPSVRIDVDQLLHDRAADAAAEELEEAVESEGNVWVERKHVYVASENRNQ